jgi:antitoxin (DNA-binding transcriptional repressor) of toxin-antitoxin stability system
MKTLEVATAKGSLAAYVGDLKERPVILTKNRRPVAALVPLPLGMDLESLSLGMNPDFWALLERSRESARKEGTIPIEEVRRRLGLPESPKPRRRKPKR